MKAKVVLHHADALDLADRVTAKSVELAYLDPPFAVGVAFKHRKGDVAYDDRWPSLEAYLAWLEPRLAVVRSLLSDQGTMWLHLDHRAIHEAKVLCDKVYGRERFVGEIIWLPGNGSKARKGPGVTHQTILLYAKTKDFVWNGDDPALRAPFAATSLSMHFGQKDESGRAYRDRTINGKTYRYYADVGRALGSVWSDIPAMLANTPLRGESTGYPTQKPLKLLDRIVRASSTEGSTVLDPFSGSGTTLEAAALLGRKAIGSDIGALAIETIEKRLRGAKIPLQIR
ncbi:MAG TPA: site-specific DNA-methyltransferase [Polyangiaceae bacterium]